MTIIIYIQLSQSLTGKWLYRTPFLRLKVNQLIAFYPFPILFANSRGDILSEV